MPKKFKYVPQEGNPNLLVAVESEEEEKQSVPTPPPAPIDRDARIVSFEDILYPLLARALAPLYTFIGYLESESGKRIYYRYDQSLSMEQKMSPLVKGAMTIEEFRIKNMHLGTAVLNLIHEERLIPAKKEFVGVSIDQFRSLYRQLIEPNATELHYQMFPVALWEILPTSTFQFIIEKSTFGAMDMAAKELELDLKMLIISDKVNYKFAQFVCKKFISPKQNAFASGMQGGNMQYRIASGFGTSVQSNTKSLLGARQWFKDVVVVDNPAIQEVEPLINLRRNQLQDIYREQLSFDRRMNGDLEGFPMAFNDMDSDQFARFEQFLVLRQMVGLRNDFLKMKYEYDNLRQTHYQKVYWR